MRKAGASECSRDAFRQRVSRARRTLRFVIDNRCGLVDPANPCRCGRQIASGEAVGLLDRTRLPLARHTREAVRVWIEPVAKQLDMVTAIGDLYRFDRFAAPAKLWDDLQARFPDLLKAPRDFPTAGRATGGRGTRDVSRRRSG